MTGRLEANKIAPLSVHRAEQVNGSAVPYKLPPLPKGKKRVSQTRLSFAQKSKNFLKAASGALAMRTVALGDATSTIAYKAAKKAKTGLNRSAGALDQAFRSSIIRRQFQKRQIKKEVHIIKLIFDGGPPDV